MKIIFTLAAVAVPFAAGQSLAPSAAGPIETLFPSAVDEPDEPLASQAPSPFENIVIDPSCSAHPECLLEGLDDPCCPTVDDVFLACCDLGGVVAPTPGAVTTPEPTPGAATPEPTTESGTTTAATTSTADVGTSSTTDQGTTSTAGTGSTPGAATPEPTPSPVESAPIASSIMPSSESGMNTAMPTEETDGGATPVPTEGTDGGATPVPTTGGDVAVPSVVTLTPRDYPGCIKVKGNGDQDDELYLAACNPSDQKQQFKFVGDWIQLEMDSSKCLQGGRDPMPSDGKYVRVFNCDEDESLQRWSWDAPDGALSLLDYPELAIVFQGTTANVNSDRIIIKDLNDPLVDKRKDWVIMN